MTFLIHPSPDLSAEIYFISFENFFDFSTKIEATAESNEISPTSQGDQEIAFIRNHGDQLIAHSGIKAMVE